MKILLYTDNHFCTSNSVINGVGEKYSTRLENQIQSLNWVEELAIRHNCDMEICLGDFFDKESINSQEISALKEIKWNHLQKEFIVGNHEIGSQDLLYNSTNALSEYGHICNRPTLIADKYCNIIMIPYILESNRKPLKEYIDEAFDNSEEEYNRDLPVVILTHNDIKGIQYGGFLTKEGFDVEEINKECKLFIDGHLHNEGIVNLSNSDIYIIGNLTGLNFLGNADIYSHCAAFLDTEHLEFGIQKIRNPYAFNFYKITIENEEDIRLLDNLKNNSVLSIKTKLSLQDKIKDIIKQKDNVIFKRITIIPEYKSANKEKQNFIKKDHIEQFKEKIRENAGTNEIIEDELRRL